MEQRDIVDQTDQPEQVDQPGATGQPDEIDQPSPEEQRQALRTGGLLSAAGGAVLFISMLLSWYKDDLGKLPAKAQASTSAETYNAFQGLERTDVLLAVVAGLAIAAGIVAFLNLVKEPGLGGWALTGLGVVATLLVAYRGSSVPKPKAAFGVETSLQFGWYLALLSSLVVIAGGVVALRKRTRRPPWDEDEDEYETEQGGAEPESP